MFELAHFVGVTRPGFELSDEHLPADTVSLVAGAGDGDLVHRLPARGSPPGKPVWYLVPDGVVQYIAKRRPLPWRDIGLFDPVRRAADVVTRVRGLTETSPHRRRSTVPAPERARELALTAAQAAADKKARGHRHHRRRRPARHHRRLPASPRRPTSGRSWRSSTRSRSACSQLPEKAKPVRREGERAGRWVLLDYIDIVVHVQHTEEREFYALDRLWKDCPTHPVRRPRPGRRRRDRRGMTRLHRLAARQHRLERRPTGSRARPTSPLNDLGRAAGGRGRRRCWPRCAPT